MININEKYPYTSVFEEWYWVELSKLNVWNWTLWIKINHTTWTGWLQYSYHLTKNVIKIIGRTYATIDRYIVGSDTPYYSHRIPLTDGYKMAISHSVEDLLRVFEAVTEQEVNNVYENSPEFIELNKKAYEDIYFKVQDDPVYESVIAEYYRNQETFNNIASEETFNYVLTNPFGCKV